MKQKLTIVALCVVLISVLCGCESNEDSIQNTYAEIKKTTKKSLTRTENALLLLKK